MKRDIKSIFTAAIGAAVFFAIKQGSESLKRAKAKRAKDLVEAEYIAKLAKIFSPKWMHAEHYHCEQCGGIMLLWAMLNWNVNVGVRRVGGCQECGILLIERENASTVRIKIRRLNHWL